jgi:hypothetical protein
METKEKHTEQANFTNRAPSLDRNRRGPLGTLTLVAFLGYVLMHFVAFFRALLVDGDFVPPILIFAVFLLLVAGVVATGWRWAPLLGAFVSLVTATLVLPDPHNTYVLTHPAHPEFIVLVLLSAFALVALVAGIGATVQNYRGVGYESRLPHFSGISLSGLAGIVVGMSLVLLIVSTVPQTGAVSTGPNGEPAVHMTVDKFAQNVVLVPKGSKLLVINNSSVEHILQNGARDANGTSHSGTEPGAPPLRNVDITGGSQEIGPFTTAGVYHIYCTLHQGMNLTIVVQ